MSTQDTSAPAAAGPASDAGPIIVPVGHRVGRLVTDGRATAPLQVRRGGVFHELDEAQAAVWNLAHGDPAAIEAQRPWRRADLEAQRPGTEAIIDQLLALELLLVVEPHDAGEFARRHRIVPMMLGLGNSSDDPDSFGIGFLRQPVLQVSHPIYDVWQWSTMDDSLWNTCVNATDVAQRAGATDPESIDPERLLAGIMGSLHALLVTDVAYVDIMFRLSWPAGTGPA